MPASLFHPFTIQDFLSLRYPNRNIAIAAISKRNELVESQPNRI